MSLQEIYAKFLNLVVFIPLALIIFLVAGWTLIFVIRRVWSRSRDKEGLAEWQGQKRDERQRPDARLYPPSGRGMCDICEKAYDKVYYLRDGRRICPGCYALTEATGEPQETAVEDKGSANERQTESGQ